MKNLSHSKLFCLFLICIISSFVIIQENFIGEINRDGVLYLLQSDYFIKESFQKAVSVYPLPFYGFLIASINFIFNIPAFFAANLVNLSLFLITCFFLIQSVNFVSKNKVQPIFVVVAILTMIPLMDDYLPMIIRGHGYWAGSMIGFYAYLRWINNSNWFWLISWNFGFIFASLFRFEGMIFNLLLPFCYLLLIKDIPNKLKYKNFIQSLSVLIILIISILFFSFFSNGINIGRFNDFIFEGLNYIKTYSKTLNIESNNNSLNELIEDNFFSFKIFFFIFIIFKKWIFGLGIFHLILLYFCFKKKLIDNLYILIMLNFLLIHLIIVFIHLSNHYVISGRYFVASWLIAVIFSSVSLNFLWEKNYKLKILQNRSIKIPLIIVTIVSLIFLFDLKKNNLDKHAGLWVKSLKIQQENIFFNDSRIAYYSGFLSKDFIYPDLEKSLKNNYSYIVIRDNNHLGDKELIEKSLKYTVLKTFSKNAERRIIIYKRINL